MASSTAVASRVQELVALALRGQLQEEHALELYHLGAEATILLVLAASARIAKLSGHAPSTPSGMKPVYEKENTRPLKRRRKPGARNGHKGTRRPAPVQIDERQEHRLECCPDCGGDLQTCDRKRTRIIEDLMDNIRSLATEHTIFRDYCSACKKHVEPVVPDAMPGAVIGHQLVSLSSWFHYGLGITVSQVQDILNHHLQTTITPGGLIHSWQRLAKVMAPWYEEIGRQARSSAYLHADETGWRVDGRTWWLWCFCNEWNCYYMIDRSRGSPALHKFFTETFEGVLITDFWQAYWSVDVRDRQFCLPHLLRDMLGVDQHTQSACWLAFSKKLRRLLRDGIRLAARRREFEPEDYRRHCQQLDTRLMAIATADYIDADAKRLGKRMLKHRDHMFTFLDYEYVPSDNNFGERQIRPAVIIRKNSQSNRSEAGAATQSILMSVYRTLRLRGHDPIATMVEALRAFIKTGKLPPLPDPVSTQE